MDLSIVEEENTDSQDIIYRLDSVEVQQVLICREGYPLRPLGEDYIHRSRHMYFAERGEFVGAGGLDTIAADNLGIDGKTAGNRQCDCQDGKYDSFHNSFCYRFTGGKFNNYSPIFLYL